MGLADGASGGRLRCSSSLETSLSHITERESGDLLNTKLVQCVAGLHVPLIRGSHFVHPKIHVGQRSNCTPWFDNLEIFCYIPATALEEDQVVSSPLSPLAITHENFQLAVKLTNIASDL